MLFSGLLLTKPVKGPGPGKITYCGCVLWHFLNSLITNLVGEAAVLSPCFFAETAEANRVFTYFLSYKGVYAVTKYSSMKKLVVFLLIVIAFSSCGRALTPGEAANHHYKKCRDIR